MGERGGSEGGDGEGGGRVKQLWNLDFACYSLNVIFFGTVP